MVMKKFLVIAGMAFVAMLVSGCAGSSTSPPRPAPSSAAPSPRAAAPGDVDGDGHLDVVTGATDWRESRFYGADGALKQIFSPGAVVSAEAVADLDGDGKAEAIYTSAIEVEPSG
jgi:opacity protein-like surface antigen